MTSIAVVIPVRDGAAYLSACLDSVLSQTLLPSSIVVVDDGSQDDSAEIAGQYGELVQVHQQPASGAGAARNAGIARTASTHVAFLDADDVWEPHALAALLAGLGSADMVHGLVAHFVSPDLPAEQAALRLVPDGVLSALSPGGMLFTRRALEQVGPQRSDLQVGEFIDWYARATELGLTTASVDTIVVRRRVHACNTGTLRRESRVDLVRVVREALQRRQAAAR